MRDFRIKEEDPARTPYSLLFSWRSRMPYQKRAKTGYRFKKTGLRLSKKAHVVVALTGGSLEELHVFRDRKKAKAKRDELAKRYGLEGEECKESPHGKDCRWSALDEDEVHMHQVDVE
jgi:hypothetical protein